MNSFGYPVLLTKCEEGGFVVTCRDLPQLVTQGEHERDALGEAVDAMDEVFAAYMIQGLDFPLSSRAEQREHLVFPPDETKVKVALYVAKRQGVHEAG